MTSPELLARLQYLDKSAHLLAITAPSTSRYLMSRRNHLMFDNAIELSDSLRGNVCCACGSIMIIGWQASLELRSRRCRRQGHNRNQQRPTKDLVYTCDSCRRTTHIPIAPAAPNRASKSSNIRTAASVQQVNTNSAMTEPSPRATSANSSSKKRAKARKLGGLAAVLANKQSASLSSTSGFGLDLMDFMKKV